MWPQGSSRVNILFINRSLVRVEVDVELIRHSFQTWGSLEHLEGRVSEVKRSRRTLKESHADIQPEFGDFENCEEAVSQEISNSLTEKASLGNDPVLLSCYSLNVWNSNAVIKKLNTTRTKILIWGIPKANPSDSALHCVIQQNRYSHRIQEIYFTLNSYHVDARGLLASVNVKHFMKNSPEEALFPTVKSVYATWWFCPVRQTDVSSELINDCVRQTQRNCMSYRDTTPLFGTSILIWIWILPKTGEIFPGSRLLI